MKTSRPSSSSLVTTTSSISRPATPTTPTTPLPEVTLVAENLKRSKSLRSKSGNSNKYRVASAALNSGYDERRCQDKNSVSKLKENLREYLPDDWDLESTASLNSDLRVLDQNIKTISEMISNEKDLQPYQIEPKPPGRIITCFFSTCYFTLGATIVIVIVMTVMYDFGMLLLLCLMVTIFIILIILTNICVIFYQQ